MGARHRARSSTIQIIRVETVAASKCRRPNIKQFHVSIDHVFNTKTPFFLEAFMSTIYINVIIHINVSYQIDEDLTNDIHI